MESIINHEQMLRILRQQNNEKNQFIARFFAPAALALFGML